LSDSEQGSLGCRWNFCFDMCPRARIEY